MTIYAINANTFGLSQFSGFTALGLTECDGQVLFLNSTQVLEHSGSTDNGTAITAHVTTGELQLAGNQEFNVTKCSYAGHGSGAVEVTRYTAEQGAANTCPAYSQDLAIELDQYEMPLETRQTARQYKFKIGMTGAGDMLDSFDVYVNPVRHRKG